MAKDDLENTIKGIAIIIVVIWVVFELGKSAGWFDWVGPTLSVIWFIIKIIFVILLLSGVGYLIYYMKNKERIDQERERKRKEREKQEAEEKKKSKEEQEIRTGIILKRIKKLKKSELEDLDQREQNYLINKWKEKLSNYLWMDDDKKIIKEVLGEEEHKGQPPRQPISKGLRRAIFRAYGSRCAMCNNLEMLHIHHIDGNHTNDSPKNLIPLCTKCHYSRNFSIDQLKARWKPPKYKK